MAGVVGPGPSLVRLAIAVVRGLLVAARLGRRAVAVAILVAPSAPGLARTCPLPLRSALSLPLRTLSLGMALPLPVGMAAALPMRLALPRWPRRLAFALLSLSLALPRLAAAAFLEEWAFARGLRTRAGRRRTVAVQLPHLRRPIAVEFTRRGSVGSGA